MNRNLVRIGGAALALAATAGYVQRRAARAERTHRPLGRFVTVDGVRLHYLDEGDGPPLVLLHGLGSMVEDFVLSGLVREAGKRYRVIAIDRPGYGHSERPRRLRFGAAAQAGLVRKALQALDVHRPIVLGHSWGTLVAVALALEHPEVPRSLVLASGLYFPSARLDAPLLAPPAIPLLGDLLARTLSPLAARAMWPGWLRMVFGPAPVPEAFAAGFPTWLALRPGQLRAVGEDALATLGATLRTARRYRELTLPVVMVAGERDRYVSTRAHSARLHRLLPTSRLLLSPHAGHMVHHSDLPLVLSAVDSAAFPVVRAAV
ncbi:MAG TPA: alpha/beta hydrolase [Burkholderiales bacterium]|jgi:pimeloyl-ACP methyl ester carboxylesterase|nr:alpha/beta hydrolase [Burkholderiales bacterium]